MSFLRLGAECAVIDANGQVLMSRRGDLNTWALPGGRLDSHEPIAGAAAREVLEETGVQVGFMRPVGLYFWRGWARMNMLFAAEPIGGQLRDHTSETLENRYFAPDALPDTFAGHAARDALSTDIVCRVWQTPFDEQRLIRRKLRTRYVQNLLKGTPEPRHVRFESQAVAVIMNINTNRIYLLNGDLPRVRCDGRAAPWEQLEALCGDVPLKWSGVEQYPAANQFTFVFNAWVNTPASASWPHFDDTVLNDYSYMTALRALANIEGVWMGSQA